MNFNQVLKLQIILVNEKFVWVVLNWLPYSLSNWKYIYLINKHSLYFAVAQLDAFYLDFGLILKVSVNF